MLSTFSKVEQSRFEAFQRSRLQPAAVSDWLAACVSHSLWNLPHRPRPLAELTAVGQAPDITMVAAVLAKIYAQRIVQTAVQQQQQSSTTSPTNEATKPPLTVSQLRQAWRERQYQGLDPGFFLQAADERPDAATTVTPQRAYEQARLAALEAQEQYDAWKKKTETETETEQASQNDDNATTNTQQQQQQNEKEQREQEKGDSSIEKKGDKNGNDNNDDDDDEYDDDIMDLDSPEK